MNAVLITFTSSAKAEELKDPFTDFAKALKSVGGFVAKTWIQDGSTLGGFYVFTSREAAESYLNSQMVAGLTSNPAFSDFQIRQFDVLEELSALTGSPKAAAAPA